MPQVFLPSLVSAASANNFSLKQVTLWLRCIAFENNALLTKIGSLKRENSITRRRRVKGRKQARMVFGENLISETHLE
jgi:hypothetical protein